jgi:hypothetical protein
MSRKRSVDLNPGWPFHNNRFSETLRIEAIYPSTKETNFSTVKAWGLLRRSFRWPPAVHMFESFDLMRSCSIARRSLYLLDGHYCLAKTRRRLKATTVNSC